MDTKMNFCDSAPANFGFCFTTDCASAGKCLRALAARDLTTRRQRVTVINPLLTDGTGAASCRFFRDSACAGVPFGFKQALASIPFGSVAKVRGAVIQLTSQRNYYHLLNGEKPIPGDLREKIAAILIQYGAPAPVVFDRYEYRAGWEN